MNIQPAPSGETLIKALSLLPKSHPTQFGKLAVAERERELTTMWKELHESLVQHEDWSPYQGLAEQMLTDDRAIEASDLSSLLMVFNVHIRKERFCNGHFDGIVESGHLFKLLCRLRRLIRLGVPLTDDQADRYRQFCGVVRESVPHLMNVKGASLYGSPADLDPRPILIMGTNPGSGPTPWSQTVEESLDFKARNPRRHGYVDSVSGKTSILSQRLQWLVQQLGQDMREVQATNMIFRATSKASELDYPTEAKECWPVHEWLIRATQPKLMIVFGTSDPSPFNFLRRYLGWRQYTKRIYPSGHGSTKLYGVSGKVAGHNLTVLGIPHPSIYEIRTAKVASAIRPEALIAGIAIP